MKETERIQCAITTCRHTSHITITWNGSLFSFTRLSVSFLIEFLEIQTNMKYMFNKQAVAKYFYASVNKLCSYILTYHIQLGMQRAGKFPGILETFHRKFREFWRGGNFRKFWEFSILTYFQHFMRLFAQKSTELNLLCTTFEHTCSALLFRQFIGLCGSKDRTTRLYEISLDLICLVFIL